MQDQVIEFEGQQHHFPSDFTDAEISAALKSHAPATPLSTPSALDMLSGRVGRDTGSPDGPQTPSTLGKLNTMLQPMAHPQSLGDIGHLMMLPVDATRSAAGSIIGGMIRPAGTALSKYGGAAADVATSFLPAKARSALGVLKTLSPTEWNSPLTVAGREARAHAGVADQVTRGADMYAMPRTSSVVDRAPRAAQVIGEAPPPPVATPAAPVADTSTEALLRERGLDPSRVVSSTPGAAQGGVQLKTIPRAARPAINITPDSPMQLPATGKSAKLADTAQGTNELESVMGAIHGPDFPTVGNGTLNSPMQQPRVQVGAEQVGRGVGLTKEAVRQQTAPILGEAPGEASPILPKEPLGRIVDALKALPPGAEREAYVARATSGKAQWQIENIRRTLEHLGLVLPIGATALAQRQSILNQFGAPAGSGPTDIGPPR